jgi:hypothetical protein
VNGGHPSSSVHAANNGTGKESFANCVKNLANVDSVQNLTNAGNSWLASAFLSNTVSSAIQLVQDFSGDNIAQTIVSNGAIPVAQKVAQNVPNVAVSVTAASATVTSDSVSLTSVSASGTIPFGSVMQSGLSVLSSAANAKTIFDVGVAAGAAVVCSIPGIR